MADVSLNSSLKGSLARILVGRRGATAAFACVPFVVAATLPFWLGTLNLYTAGQAICFAVLGLGLMVSLGICRQANFGITPYYAIGAYGAADTAVRWHLGAIGALVVVTVVTGLIGYGIGRILLRLRQFTLAVATFVLATAVWQYLDVGFPQQYGGGDNGLLLPPMTIFGHAVLGDAGYFVALACLVLVLAGLALLMRTRTGRALHALGDDPTAAQTSGINVVHYGALGYAISASIAAMAGALFLYTVGAITPDGFNVGVNVTVLLMVVLGGLSTLAGPVIGAVFIIVLNQILESALSYSVLIDGVVLLAVVRFAPQGVAGLVVRWLDHLRSAVRADVNGREVIKLEPTETAGSSVPTGSGA